MRQRLFALVLLIVPVAALAADGLDAALGRALFKRNWVPAPSSTDAANGLGPLFNARACAACHLGGGPARLAADSDGRKTIRGAVVRLGDAAGRTDPYYGQQVQTNGVPGMDTEGRVRFLPRLKLALIGPDLAPGIKTGVRLAPSLLGRAALDGISDGEILKRADPEDRDHDGIRGRARRIGADGRLGRFGWKAGQATLEGQIANAFALDLGLSSPLDPRPYGDCTAAEKACLAAPNGESGKQDGREISAEVVRLVGDYIAGLAAPEIKALAPDDLALFEKTGCAACHVPRLLGQDGKPVPTYSDLLLHDMGAGLDDGVGEEGVASAEWRTAPLLDLDSRGGTRRYLHDGRAATLTEAIGQHGGEASVARHNFDKLDATKKHRLIGFLKQL